MLRKDTRDDGRLLGGEEKRRGERVKCTQRDTAARRERHTFSLAAAADRIIKGGIGEESLKGTGVKEEPPSVVFSTCAPIPLSPAAKYAVLAETTPTPIMIVSR